MIDKTKIILVEKINEVHLKLYCTYIIEKELCKYLSVYAKNYKFDKRYKARMWDGKISFYDPRSSLLPIGLHGMLVEFATEQQYQIIYEDESINDINDIAKDEFMEFVTSINIPEDRKPRDYQLKAAYMTLKYSRGLYECATGAGKSIIVYLTCRYWFNKLMNNNQCMVIVPNVTLVGQLLSDFKEYGWEDADMYISLRGGGSKMYDPNKPIQITTWQSIKSEPNEMFQTVDMVCVDEAHALNSESRVLKDILSKCVNAKYRYGMTGTVPLEKIDRLNLYGMISPITMKITTDELMKRNILSKLELNVVEIQYPDWIRKLSDKMQYHSEVEFLNTLEERNTVIVDIINNVDPTDNILILCNYIEHLEHIQKSIETCGKQIYVIHGKCKAEERERIRKEMGQSEGAILLATYGTLSTGVNIPKLHHVIFASSTKSYTRTIQSIGRGLRLHATKNFATLWDLVDNMTYTTRNGSEHHNYMMEQFLVRSEYYITQKFKVNTITKPLVVKEDTNGKICRHDVSASDGIRGRKQTNSVGWIRGAGK